MASAANSRPIEETLGWGYRWETLRAEYYRNYSNHTAADDAQSRADGYLRRLREMGALFS